MNKSEILKALAEKSELTQKQCEAVMNAFTNVVREQTLEKNDSIKWPDLGTFKQKFTKGGTKMNQLLHRLEERPAKTSVRFNPASFLVKRG